MLILIEMPGLLEIFGHTIGTARPFQLRLYYDEWLNYTPLSIFVGPFLKFVPFLLLISSNMDLNTRNLDVV